MKRRLATISLLVVLTAIALGSTLLWMNRPPAYQGRTLEEWMERSRSRDSAVRKEAVAALQAMEGEAVPFLAASLTRQETVLECLNRAVRNKVPATLKKLGGSIFEVGAMNDRKAEAVRAIELLGTNAWEAVPALGELLRGSNVRLSSLAGDALAEVGPAAVPELLKALEEADYTARANACSALGKLRTNALPAAPRLVQMLAEEAGPILGSAAYGLARIGQGALPALEPAFTQTNWVTRRWAAYAVGFMVPGPVDAARYLYPLTRDPHPEVRLVAVQSLGRMHLSSGEGIAVLRERFADPSPEVRSAAIQAFANSPWMVPRHLEACIELLSDPSPPGARLRRPGPHECGARFEGRPAGTRKTGAG